MDKQALLNDIRTELSKIGSSAPALSTRNAADKLYEIFILARVMRVMAKVGATLSPMDGYGFRAGTLRFRLRPGRLKDSLPYGYILVRHAGSEYEVHNSLQVQGRSEVLHELDISVLVRRNCNACRRDRTDPAARHVRALAECKCYDASDLDLGLGRGFIGLLQEFRSSKTRIRVFISNKAKPEIATMARKYNGRTHFGICPSNPSELACFDNWLEVEIRSMLGI